MLSQIQVKSFILEIGKLARAEALRRKKNNLKRVLPSVCIAQACLESGYGTSKLMTKANAYFGIKASKSWKGKVYSSDTNECYKGVTVSVKGALFRAYDSKKESIEDYFNLICNSSRYAKATNINDARKCITAIKNGGYATDPEYIDKVMSIINKYNLTAYDAEVIDTRKYYKKCDSKYKSIVDALNSIDVNSSYSNRRNIASVNGIANYNGKANQNTTMLILLKMGKLVRY